LFLKSVHLLAQRLDTFGGLDQGGRTTIVGDLFDLLETSVDRLQMATASFALLTIARTSAIVLASRLRIRQLTKKQDGDEEADGQGDQLSSHGDDSRSRNLMQRERERERVKERDELRGEEETVRCAVTRRADCRINRKTPLRRKKVTAEPKLRVFVTQSVVNKDEREIARRRERERERGGRQSVRLKRKVWLEERRRENGES
jgi:hypothetical protein